MDLVFEIGTEELPASFQKPALDWMRDHFHAEMMKAGLTAGEWQSHATPRRLAFIASNLPEGSKDEAAELKGPPANSPAQVKEGFARKQGVSVEDLFEKDGRLWAKKIVKGARTSDALPAILSDLIAKVPFKKAMRWGNEDVTFARPVQWIGAALDGKALAITFGDVKSGTKTRGHRFHANDWIELPSAAHYVSTLRKAHVLTDWQERKEAVWREVERAAKEAGGEARPDEDLLETVTGLVEEPSGVHGTFDGAFLELPPEVLISEMRGHQKYFAVQDAHSKKLLPAFVAISNTKVVDPAVSRRGYERVLRARLSDGKFFFDEDRKTKLSSRNARLERTVFLQGLGTQWDRVQRIKQVALWLNEKTKLPTDAINAAAEILKSDLATGMVGEFPDLQGVMGREYALLERQPREVADAIFEHYLPRGAEDRLPESDLGALFGIADRLDQLAGIFGIGKEPTGTADPYGLRRAAIGLIRLVLHKQWKIDVREALAVAVQGVPNARSETAERLWQFLLGRLQSYWSAEFTTFELQMALGRATGNLLDLRERLDALRGLRGSPELQEAAAAFKRIQNILAQAHDKGIAPMHFDAQALAEPAERNLAAACEKARDAIFHGSYQRKFEALAALRDPLARFFEEVMVMVPDERVRDNRLALLRQLHELFAPLADFSKLQIEKAG